ANITDLHAFLVDSTGAPVRTAEQIARADQLIVSLCVRRRLLHSQIDDPKLVAGLPELSFRVHLDLDSDVAHYDPKILPDGRVYEEELKQLGDQIEKLKAAAAKDELAGALAARDLLTANHQLSARMEALYGGTILAPTVIAEEVVLDFRLKLLKEKDTVS